jgi:hypothetical protein
MVAAARGLHAELLIRSLLSRRLKPMLPLPL